MDIVKEKQKKNLIAKAWGRCKSLGTGFTNINNTTTNNIIKSSLRRSSTVGPFPPPRAEGDQSRRRRRRATWLQKAVSGCTWAQKSKGLW
uniref:Uncharacterized protein n=1 Tax=Cannabis sativa TaxID=3483 RepID=A0A803QXU1_CANSA